MSDGILVYEPEARPDTASEMLVRDQQATD